MGRQAVRCVLAALAVMILAVGCSSSSSDDDINQDMIQQFVGKWELPFADTGKDALDVQFNADGTLLWYKHNATVASASGTFIVEDNVLKGVWRHSYVDLHGTCTGTLIDANTLDYLVYEELPTGIKTNHFRGPRIR